MDEVEAEVSDAASMHKPRAASAASTASSDLTSLSSIQTLEKQPTPAMESKKERKGPRDYGKDFFSYYVTGDPDDKTDEETDDEVKVVPPPSTKSSTQAAPPPPSKPVPPAPAPPAHPPASNHVVQRQAPQQTHQVWPPVERFRNHTGPPPPYPTSAREKPMPRPPLPPPAQPVVVLIDDIQPVNGPQLVPTVRDMIRKLEMLSHQLAAFGALPTPDKDSGQQHWRPTQTHPIPETTQNAVSKPPPDKADSSGNVPQEKGQSAADDLLALFDDDDNDSSDGTTQASHPQPPAEEVKEPSGDLDRVLEPPGMVDHALSYGIKFIQNALKSWAHHRLSVSHSHYYWHAHNTARQQVQAPKRGPGRPRKFGEDDVVFNLPPAQWEVPLSKTVEGAAIAAFQDVLDSRCLQVNAKLPTELARALRVLYRQIDTMINQGPRNEPPWQCLSYGAQIAAHRLRMEEWNAARSRVAVEAQRQQSIAEQTVLQQMGIFPTRSAMMEEQIQRDRALELERRRNAQQAVQQPHLSASIMNPISLAEQITARATAANNSAPPQVNGFQPQAAPGHPGPSNMPANTSNTTPVHSSPSITGGLSPDKLQSLASNLFSRSGQSMRFSFAPNSELAVKAFGPQAFPGNYSGPNLPNRGPMRSNSASSAIPISSSPHQEPAPQPHVGKPPPLTREPSDTIQVASRPSSRQTAQPPSIDLTKQSVDSGLSNLARPKSSSTLKPQSTSSPTTDSINLTYGDTATDGLPHQGVNGAQ